MMGLVMINLRDRYKTLVVFEHFMGENMTSVHKLVWKSLTLYYQVKYTSWNFKETLFLIVLADKEAH